MRPFRPLFLAFALSLGVACTPVRAPAPSPSDQGPFVPLPASVEWRRGEWTPQRSSPADLALASDAELALAGIRVRLAPADSARGRESYRLEVTREGAQVTAPSDAGRFYALVT